MAENNDEYIDKAVDNLITILPLLSKNLVRIMRNKTTHTPGTLYLMGALIHHGDMTMSEIGVHLVMPKPNVTSLVDRLIKDKLIERFYSPDDRRVIFIRITETGIEHFHFIKSELAKDMRDKLKDIESDELKSLAHSSEKVRDVLRWALQKDKACDPSKPEILSGKR
jgi:DNA-binding MarR family transcriptional regulator